MKYKSLIALVFSCKSTAYLLTDKPNLIQENTSTSLKQKN